MEPADWPAVRAIYEEGLATGHASFETAAPERADWDAAHHLAPRLVARDGSGRVAGWAALSPVSKRPVYRGVAEVSIYVGAAARGRGVGRALLDALVLSAEAAGFWTLQSSVWTENTHSLALHRACGFRLVGRRVRIGERLGVWHDTLILERRSAVLPGAPAPDDAGAGDPPGRNGARTERALGMQANNTAWTLAEQKRRTRDEDARMLNAAHAAAWHWARIGTGLQQARARLLLAHVQAATGGGAPALRAARESASVLLRRGAAAWETALTHAVLAGAARAAGRHALHARHYALAVAAREAIGDPEEREIVHRTLRLIPAPRRRRAPGRKK